FQSGQFLFRIGRELGFNPVIDLRPVEAPMAGNLLSGQIAPARQLAHVAQVATQIGSELLKSHHLIAHGLASSPGRPCSANRAYRPGPSNPGKSKPLPPLSN